MNIIEKIVIISSTEISIRLPATTNYNVSKYYHVTLITNVQNFDNLKSLLPKIDIINLNIKEINI